MFEMRILIELKGRLAQVVSYHVPQHPSRRIRRINFFDSLADFGLWVLVHLISLFIRMLELLNWTKYERMTAFSMFATSNRVVCVDIEYVFGWIPFLCLETSAKSCYSDTHAHFYHFVWIVCDTYAVCMELHLSATKLCFLSKFNFICTCVCIIQLFYCSFSIGLFSLICLNWWKSAKSDKETINRMLSTTLSDYLSAEFVLIFFINFCHFIRIYTLDELWHVIEFSEGEKNSAV